MPSPEDASARRRVDEDTHKGMLGLTSRSMDLITAVYQVLCGEEVSTDPQAVVSSVTDNTRRERLQFVKRTLESLLKDIPAACCVTNDLICRLLLVWPVEVPQGYWQWPEYQAFAVNSLLLCGKTLQSGAYPEQQLLEVWNASLRARVAVTASNPGVFEDLAVYNLCNLFRTVFTPAQVHGWLYSYLRDEAEAEGVPPPF